jgi:hypothetical protein
VLSRAYQLGIIRARVALFFPALLPDGTVAVNAAALEEAVTHHAVSEHKKEDCQEQYE